METLDAIRDRRSIRRYKPDPIPLDIIEKIINAGRWAPTGGNRQYWKFIVVTDPNLMKNVKRISPMMWGESPVSILVCLDLNLGNRADPGFASQNIMLAAYALGLGTCAIAGFNRAAIKNLLCIPDDMEPKLLISLGYPDESPKPKPRRPIHEIAYLNYCKNPWRDECE